MAAKRKRKAPRLRPVVIDRARWLTGEVVDEVGVDSQLYNPAVQMMCCLGFVCLEAGVGLASIRGCPTPMNLSLRARQLLHDSGLLRLAAEGVAENSALCGEAMDANDVDSYDNVNYTGDTPPQWRKQRERRVAALLKRMGWKVRFVGAYPDYSTISVRKG